jgi:hypothetical protein
LPFSGLLLWIFRVDQWHPFNRVPNRWVALDRVSDGRVAFNLDAADRCNLQLILFPLDQILLLLWAKLRVNALTWGVRFLLFFIIIAVL